jgi:hypothetical protein
MQADHFLFLDTLHVDIAEGTVRARGYLDGRNAEKIYLKSTIKLDDVNLEKMLLKLDYLGQDYVINKNITWPTHRRGYQLRTGASRLYPACSKFRGRNWM